MIKFSEYNLSDDEYKWQDLFFIVLAGVTILTSALHFWPFGNNKIWQIFNMPNLCCMAAMIVVLFLIISKKNKQQILDFIPHISVLAYLAINILSIAFADTLSRPLNYIVKLILVFLGGLFLLQRALSKPKILNLFYTLATVAVSVSIISCVYTRLVYDSKQFGLHGNVFKYGTYIGILVSLASVYLLSGSKLQIIWAMSISAAGVFSAGSAGAVLSIFTGLLAGFALSKRPSVRTYISVCILLSAIVLPISNKVFDNTIRKDFALKENDSTNLRQRYVEWQAELNLLEKRGITGTSAGCVNDYRSNFYYRLPKLNTLKAFDQNGFMAVGAETGLLGLAAFVWILIHYGRMCLKSYLSLRPNENPHIFRVAAANIAAIVSAMTANLFSSVHYNGNLIVFVFLLSLISSANRIYGGNTGED